MANLKGGNVVVRFLLAHGEKIGVAAVLLCAAMLFWSAVSHDHLGSDQQPDDLRQLASQASQHIEQFTWDGLDEEHKLQAEHVSAEAMKPVVVNQFPPITPWDRPVLAPVTLRTDPELLTIEDLEVHGDSGLWAFADPEIIRRKQLEAMKEQDRLRKEEAAARERELDQSDRLSEEGAGRGREMFDRGRGGRERETTPARREGPVVVSSNSRTQLAGFEDIKSKSWVTVVAKVPIEKQYKLYDEALMNSSGYNANQDIPNYLGYIVERAEVTDEGQGDWSQVDVIKQKTLDNDFLTYPFNPEELISSRYTHPLLTHPLPPLILREWDRRVTHSSIPLVAEEVTESEMETDGTEPSDSDQPAEDDALFGIRSPDRAGDLRGEGGIDRRGQGRGSMYSRLPMMGGGEAYREGAYMGGEPGMSRSYSRSGMEGSFSWDGETPYVLFRYFDDSVQPGHRYRYRIRLALVDVNQEVPEQYLDKTVTERRNKIQSDSLKVYRLTDWSEPSPVASVPLPARVYLVSGDPAKESNYNDEPEAKFLVQAFNSLLPAEIAREEDFLRGSLLNVQGKASVIWVNRSDFTEAQANQEFDFRTGITVLDFRGGDRLSTRNRDLTVPAQAVLMDPAGRLFLQSELEDRQSVEDYQRALEGDERDMPGFGGRGEGGIFFEGT
jgi:hypothetical protein